jgi:2-dehydropantoate 2-reductase
MAAVGGALQESGRFMKVCVYGAGVIGGILASALQRSGHDVSMIARGATLDAIAAHGLIVQTPSRRLTTSPRVTSNPREIGSQDLVIVSTKTPSLPDVAHAVMPLLDERTLVAFAQNGIFWFYGDGFAPGGLALAMNRMDPDGRLHAAVGAGRALGLLCYAGGEAVEPGVIEMSRDTGRFVCGAALGSSRQAAAALVAELRPADCDLAWTDDVRHAMWLKYMSVVGNFATCALTGGTIADVHGDRAAQSVQLALTAEAHAVAIAHGFTSLGFDLERARANPSVSTHKPSMLQDLERGRIMEIDSVYLILQDLARQVGIATPALDLVTALLALRARAAGCLSTRG